MAEEQDLKLTDTLDDQEATAGLARLKNQA
jgi:hypothetical protein